LKRVIRYVLAAAIAASAVPFVALAASGEETVGVTSVSAFPILQGLGLSWDTVEATGYRVERKLGDGEWQDASGVLAASTSIWVDRTLAAGATADYRVVAQSSDSDGVPSAPVTATRAGQDPVVGDVDVLMIDANRGDSATWLQDEIAEPVSASVPSTGSRTLSAGTIKLRIPAVLPGPGRYDVAASQLEVTQGDRSCATSGKLTVTALAYTPDLQLETMAASFDSLSCTGTQNGVHGEIRVKSAKGYSALSVDPYELGAGQIRVGTTSAPHPITLRNAGSEPLQLDKLELRAGYNPDWVLASNDCPSVLPAAASCTTSVTFKPTHTGVSEASLVVSDSTSMGWHTIALTGTGTSLPYALDVGVWATFTGHIVQWPALSTAGGTTVRGYYLHRYVDGVESTRWLYPQQGRDGESMIFTDSKPQAGVKYAVSVVNGVGEGPTGTPRAPARATEQLAVISGSDPSHAELMGADVSGRLVPFPADTSTVTPKEAVTSSPDGRSLAYVAGGSDHSLWVRRVAPGELGEAVKLWSSPAPIAHPAWSPDGSQIAFEVSEGTEDSRVPCVYVISSTGGTPKKIACSISSPSWMPDARTLAVVDNRLGGDTGYLARIEAQPGGTRLKRFDVQASDGVPVRVSPNGNFIAFGSGDTVRTISIEGESTHSSGRLKGGVISVSWRPSGGRLLALTADGQLSSIDVSNDGVLTQGTPSTIWPGRTPSDKVDVTWQGLGVTIRPTAAVMGPRVSIPFDSSALAPGTTVTCYLSGATIGKIEPCASPATATFLSSGTHALYVTGVEPGGRAFVATRTFTVDATGPVTQIVAPAAEASTSASVAVRYAATDASGVTSYDVRYRKAPYLGTFGAYSQPWTNTTATSVNLGVAAGYEYCVSARARDKFSNLGGWSAERCFTRPMDDRSLASASTGWTRANWSAFYLSTATQSTKYGASLTRTVQGKRFYLVATRCNTCGVVSVYLGGKYLTAVNLWTSTTQRQVVIGLPAQSSVFGGTLTITTRSTGKLVQIDGLGVRRT
jgi:hypothetical protein